MDGVRARKGEIFTPSVTTGESRFLDPICALRGTAARSLSTTRFRGSKIGVKAITASGSEGSTISGYAKVFIAAISTRSEVALSHLAVAFIYAIW